MKKYSSYFCILAAGSAWGLIGIFNRPLLLAGFTPKDIVLLRNLGSLILMTLIFLAADRSVFKVSWKHLPFFFGTGVVSILFFTLCYFSCQQQCSLAVAAILLYTAPTFVVLMTALLWKESITRKKIFALIVSFLGCSFASGIWGGGLHITGKSLLLGLGSGFFYATYSIFSRCGLKYYKPMTVIYYTFVFAGLGSVFVASPARTVMLLAADWTRIWLACGLIIISSVLPYFFYTKALVCVESGKASILASIEPVVASLAGAIVLGEPLSLSTLLGLACILTAIWVLK